MSSRRLAAALAGGTAVLAVSLATALVAVSGAAASGPLLPSSDPFYAYSGSLAHLAPGTVLRRRTVSVVSSGISSATATQVLYRTTGELGQPTATVATVIGPAVQLGAPKLVSYQTAYDALGSECDPSYTLQGGNPGYSTAAEEEQVILAYVRAGYTVVVPDYEGERLDWGAGQESGYGTLDGIRAAENLLGVPVASTPVGMVGYSGGSIATEFASELAPGYSPTLDIVATAEGGIPVDFFHNLSYINGSPAWSGVIPAVLVSVGRAFGIDFQRYLSPYGVGVTNQVKGECINDFVGAYPGLTYQKLLKPQYQDIYKIADFVKVGDHLIMTRTGTPKGPLFIGVGDADGTGDGVMVTRDDLALAHTYCQRGVSVQFNQYGGDDHDQAAVPFEQGALTFLSERLAGTSVPDGCGSIGAGNSLTPLPVPIVAPKLKLKLTYLGPRKRLHGIVIELATSTASLRGLVVSLWRGRKLIARVKINRLTTSAHRVILRNRGHLPGAGRYTLKITEGKTTLLVRGVRIR
ncbi:MAG: triacylglycerol lipase [Solirubrobacterales bacterium]|nr:triacylglycerol lipase [Solirubrobacterales bacterium]